MCCILLTNGWLVHLTSRKESKISLDKSMRAIVSEKYIRYCSCALHVLTQCNQINFTTRERTRERSVDIDAKIFGDGGTWIITGEDEIEFQLRKNHKVRYQFRLSDIVSIVDDSYYWYGFDSTSALALCLRWWVDFSKLQVEWRTSLKVVEMLFYIFLWCSYKTKWHALGMLGPKR